MEASENGETFPAMMKLLGSGCPWLGSHHHKVHMARTKQTARSGRDIATKTPRQTKQQQNETSGNREGWESCKNREGWKTGKDEKQGRVEKHGSMQQSQTRVAKNQSAGAPEKGLSMRFANIKKPTTC